MFLAALITANMVSSVASAEGLTLPQQGAEPVTLALQDRELAMARPSEVLEVFVGQVDACCKGRTPMAGRYAVTKDGLCFTPSFGFDAGQDYVARVRASQIDALVAFRLPSQAETVPASVTKFYPSGDMLPENTLRFYLHFSVPMAPHVALDHIKLRDASNTVDEAAFMRFKQELWNEDRTRLTVLMDPGRIKREVETNMALGPALRAGQQYSIFVKGGWPSADGASVLPSFARNFTVSPALRHRPDVRLWTVTAPCIGTRDLLKIDFDRPFDGHLSRTHIQIISKDGRRTGGTVHIGAGEMSWDFAPDAAWADPEVFVVAHPRLEDVAGNNFRDLLDHTARDTPADVSETSIQVNLNDCSEQGKHHVQNSGSRTIGN